MDKAKRKAELKKVINRFGWIQIGELVKTQEDKLLLEEIHNEWNDNHKKRVEKTLKKMGISF